MNTKEIRERKLGLKLTDRQRAIIVGLLLGDGHLETQNGGRTYRLKVEHGFAQADYVRWLFQELREWIPADKPYVKVRTDGVQNAGFTTYSHGSLRFYGQQFYDGKRKRMPKIIAKMIEPISIAVWFMDDGSRKSVRHLSYIIHTLGYSKQDLEVAQKALQDRFGIQAIRHRQKEKYWRLYIPSESARQFESLIGEYVRPIASMKHKLVTQLPKK
jgi:LAGLIDADG DNA endonuclease family